MDTIRPALTWGGRGGALVALVVLLSWGGAEPRDGPLFYYGEIVDVNPGSRVITLKGDHDEKWRFQVSSWATLEHDLEHPRRATFEELQVGVRVRVLAGSPTMNPTILGVVSVLVYD